MIVIDSGLSSIYSKHSYVTLPSMHASVLTWMWEEDSVSAAVASWLLPLTSVAIVKDACPTGVGSKSKNTCQWTAVATLSHKKNLKVGVCRAKRYSSYQWYLILLQTDSWKMRRKNVCVCEITNPTVSCFTVFWLPSMYLNLNFSKVLQSWVLWKSHFWEMLCKPRFFLWSGWKAKLSGVVK